VAKAAGFFCAMKIVKSLHELQKALRYLNEFDSQFKANSSKIRDAFEKLGQLF